MCSLEPLKIDLKGLKDGDTTLTFSLDDSYFETISASEVQKGEVKAELSIHNVGSRYFDLDFHITGKVVVACDRCLDDMPLAIDARGKLVARFGEEYSEEDDLVIVPEDEGVLDTTWIIYEFIALNIPIKHVHAPGKCNRAMIEMLQEHSTSAARSSDGVETTAIDPRWSELLKLKDLKN